MTGKPLDRHLRSAQNRVPAEGQSLSRRASGPDYRIDPETGCWEWLRWKLRGYGRAGFSGHSQHAHRAYYEAANGPIPEGQHVHHRCENPGCVNPDHLELTTHALHLAYHKQEASSLSWDDVRAIRQAVKDGERQQDIRARYGIAQPTLSDIITNTTWKDSSYTPGRPVTCDECGVTFSAFKANQRFCCKDHRRRFNGRKTWRRKHWGSEVRDAA